MAVKHRNLRGGRYPIATAWETDVTEDSGQKIGVVYAERQDGATLFRHISLYGGKYEGQFRSREECDAFEMGVRAVIKHLTSVSDQQAQSEAAE